MKQKSGLLRAIHMALALAAAGPAAAQTGLPEPADANERALLPDIGQALGGGKRDLATLDALLAKLPHPTRLRGAIQWSRARYLLVADRYVEGLPPGEEAVRLLPDLPGPKLVLSYLLLWTGQPQRAADLWLEASRLSPAMTRESDTYSLYALVGRLGDIGDAARARAVRARMGEIGVMGMLTPDRSEAASAAVAQAIGRGDGDGARLALGEVANPDRLQGFAVDRRYQALWPAIDERAGPALAVAQRSYFAALRGEWQRERNFETATNYARALASVHAYPAVVMLFGPMMDEAAAKLDDDQYAWFLAPVLARALAETGRLTEGRALLQRLGGGTQGNVSMRLNATGNLANLSYLTQQWSQAATESADWLRIAKAEGPNVDRSSVLQVSGLRACALIKTGHADQAAPLVGDILLAQRAVPGPAAALFECTGDLPKLRALLIDRLGDPDNRMWALDVLQPSTRTGSLPEEVAEFRVLDQVRRDPAVRAAAEKVGRLMAQPFAETLPPGFDPDGSDKSVRVGPHDA